MSYVIYYMYMHLCIYRFCFDCAHIYRKWKRERERGREREREREILRNTTQIQQGPKDQSRGNSGYVFVEFESTEGATAAMDQASDRGYWTNEGLLHPLQPAFHFCMDWEGGSVQGLGHLAISRHPLVVHTSLAYARVHPCTADKASAHSENIPVCDNLLGDLEGSDLAKGPLLLQGGLQEGA